jgi:type IX secretion system PorP/SprF family membrane protein
MKKTFILILLNLTTIMLFAQSNIRLNNDWNKMYIINPASINDQYLAEFNMAARQQWTGFQGSPTTLFASGTLYVDDLYTQFGLKVMQDKIGFTSTTNIDLTYAYAARVNDDWKLNMGLGLSFQMLGYDVSQVISPTPTDPTVLNGLIKQNNVNSDIGFELTNLNCKFGLASQNIFTLFSPVNKMFPNTNFVYAMYLDSSHDAFNMGYGACGIQYSNIYQMEFNLTGYFKPNASTNPIQLGLIYRTWSEIGVLFGFDISHNFRVSYSYDYNFSGISNASFGTHELMLTYRLDKVYHCKNCWY